MFKSGLILCTLLGIADVAGLAALGSTDSDGNGPPAPIIILAAFLGVATLAAMRSAWKSANVSAIKVVLTSRAISALTSIPAFFVGDVSTGLKALAIGSLVLTAIAAFLVVNGVGVRRHIAQH